MPAERRFGMDHEHHEWDPIINRGKLRWPSAPGSGEPARVALSVVVNLEHMEWQAPEGSFSTSLGGGLGARGWPDYAQLSHREYGHRVGIFRILDTLEKHGIKATIAMDALTAEHYPYLVEHCLGRGCEIIGHGISVSQMITSRMTEQEETDYIQSSVDAITRATGSAPVGWLGPEYGESARTPKLLSAAGIQYVCDWANDEQPYRIISGQGDMFALPLMVELDDLVALWARRVTVGRYRDMLKDGFDTLHQDGAENGRLLAINIHPWLMGQPFRIGYLDDALSHMMRQGGVWAATGSEVMEWYRNNPPAA